MRFWLGTNVTNWLWTTDVDLIVSHRTLRKKRKRFPRATCEWVLDSGGFTEISTYGHWTITPEEYIEATHRYQNELGGMRWAAPQDWMCEPWILSITGKSVSEHQALTVESYLELRDHGPYVPVLQGWSADDYWRHVTMYDDAGIDLRDAPLVGLGSVCRRQGMLEAATLVTDLSDYGIALHGFGFKRTGLRRVGDRLASADSMAWSFDARRTSRLPGHTHQRCTSCVEWALAWRTETLRQLTEPYVLPFERECSRCGEVKRLEAFSRDRRRRSGSAGKCQQCKNEQRQESRRALDNVGLPTSS